MPSAGRDAEDLEKGTGSDSTMIEQGLHDLEISEVLENVRRGQRGYKNVLKQPLEPKVKNEGLLHNDLPPSHCSIYIYILRHTSTLDITP